jgi:hypothetical protein
MRIEYRVEDAGWATVDVVCSGHHLQMTASYLHDSLRELARMALAVDVEDESRVVFMDEPGEHHLIVRRETAEILRVEVRYFQDWKSWNMDDGDGELRLQCATSPAELRWQVLAALRSVLAECGVDGYREKWGEHEFPTSEYAALCGKAG